MSDARKRAEEAIVLVNECCDAADKDCVSTLLSAVAALLAEEPEAANFIRCAVPRGECCHQRIPAVLPLEAPECNDGDDCCRYCGRGLQPCGACKAPPPADAATEAVEAARELLHAVRAGRLSSIGSINNTYSPQIGREWLRPIEAKIEAGVSAIAARRGA